MGNTSNGSRAWLYLIAIFSTLFIVPALSLGHHQHSHQHLDPHESSNHNTPRAPSSNSTAADVIDRWISEHPDLAAQIDPVKLENFKEDFRSGNNTATKRDQKHMVENSSRIVMKRQNATQIEINNARDIIKAAHIDVGAENLEIRSNPRLNQYRFRDKSAPKLKSRSAEVVLNGTVASAAAIVAEADAKARALNGTLNTNYALPSGFPSPPGHGGGNLRKRTDAFWLETVGSEYTGSFPLDPDAPSDYKVFRNVRDYGAVGDGMTDDTAAINRAISDGNRCGEGCGSTSVKGAIVYFPPGTYLVSTPIILYYNTQMVGDYNTLPIIRAATSFTGLGVISADVYLATGEWYVDTDNFFRSCRNFIVDVTWATVTAPAGVHWQVAQATSLENMYFYLNSDAAQAQVGVFAENGSGGFMSQLIFYNGFIGLQCGNQQFTTRNIQFLDCTTGISLLWDWGWTFKSVYIKGSENAITIAGDTVGGSIYLLDSAIVDSSVGIAMPDYSAELQLTNYVNIDNLILINVPQTITQGGAAYFSAGDTTLSTWVYGKVYDSEVFFDGVLIPGHAMEGHPHPNTSSLGGGPNYGYFERERPQYSYLEPENFLNAHKVASGNGVDDDTAALNLLMEVVAKTDFVLYMPAGTYLVTDTVYVPAGAMVVGECWSQIMATGTNFQDMSNPRVMLQVGASGGENGDVEISNVLFTVQGPTAGAVLVEWNMNQTSPASAGMWDSHFRVGGALGSDLQVQNCPTLTGNINSNCIAASLLLHLTKYSTAYLENIWAWTADHDMDDPDVTQVDVYSARGILIESQGPCWLYGTASEHNVLYQYMLYEAKDIFMGMIQTESPYYPPAPQAPAPFEAAVGLYASDPIFELACYSALNGCNVSWALSIKSSENIQIGGAGLYSWFQDYDEDCVNTQNCQLRLVHTDSNTGLYINNLYTIGAVEMVVPETSNISTALASNNTNQVAYPWLSVISSWVDLANNFDNLAMCDWDDDSTDCLVDPICDDSLDFATLDDLADAAGSIPSVCLDAYTMPIFSSMMDEALSNYTNVNDGYDAVFGYYVKYIKSMVPDQIAAFMNDADGPGNKYFECVWSEAGVNRTSVPCPNDVEENGTMYYVLLNETGFFNEIETTYGIDPSWIQFGDETIGACTVPTECPNGVTGGILRKGFPLAADDISVSNPKDVVVLALANITALQSSIDDPYFEILLGQWDGSDDDVSQVTSIPAFMLSQAVDSMYTVKDIGETEKKQEQLNLIFEIVTAVLCVIPFLGPAASQISGVADLARIIQFISTAGNVAVSIAEVVQDPQSAPMAIMGLLLGAVDLRDAEGFKSAATARKAMTDDTVSSLGAVFKDYDNKFQSIVKACRG